MKLDIAKEIDIPMGVISMKGIFWGGGQIGVTIFQLMSFLQENFPIPYYQLLEIIKKLETSKIRVKDTNTIEEYMTLEEMEKVFIILDREHQNTEIQEFRDTLVGLSFYTLFMDSLKRL